MSFPMMLTNPYGVYASIFPKRAAVYTLQSCWAGVKMVGNTIAGLAEVSYAVAGSVITGVPDAIHSVGHLVKGSTGIVRTLYHQGFGTTESRDAVLQATKNDFSAFAGSVKQSAQDAYSVLKEAGPALKERGGRVLSNVREMVGQGASAAVVVTVESAIVATKLANQASAVVAPLTKKLADRTVQAGHDLKDRALEAGHAAKEVASQKAANLYNTMPTASDLQGRFLEAGHALKDRVLEVGHAVKEKTMLMAFSGLQAGAADNQGLSDEDLAVIGRLDQNPEVVSDQRPRAAAAA